MLRITPEVQSQIVEHCLHGRPEEACGLLGGTVDGGAADATVCYPGRNLAASATLYELDPKDYLLADRDAEDRGLEIVGVFHSHTHTEAYPSPTDVARAPDPSWHYVLVSLRNPEPELRSFRIIDGVIEEEPLRTAVNCSYRGDSTRAVGVGGPPPHRDEGLPEEQLIGER